MVNGSPFQGPLDFEQKFTSSLKDSAWAIRIFASKVDQSLSLIVAFKSAGLFKIVFHDYHSSPLESGNLVQYFMQSTSDSSSMEFYISTREINHCEVAEDNDNKE